MTWSLFSNNMRYKTYLGEPITVWKVVKMCFVGYRGDNTYVIQNSATQNEVDPGLAPQIVFYQSTEISTDIKSKLEEVQQLNRTSLCLLM